MWKKVLLLSVLTVASCTTSHAPKVPPVTTTTVVTTTTTSTTTMVVPTTVAPKQQPAPTPIAPPTTLRSLLVSVIPARWLSRVPVANIRVIPGYTSYAEPPDGITISRGQLVTNNKARFVLAHEWGHLLAQKYGSHLYVAAPPADFPYNGPGADEVWAECVARSLTGMQYRTSTPCSNSLRNYVVNWLDTH